MPVVHQVGEKLKEEYVELAKARCASHPHGVGGNDYFIVAQIIEPVLTIFRGHAAAG